MQTDTRTAADVAAAALALAQELIELLPPCRTMRYERRLRKLAEELKTTEPDTDA